LHYRQNRVFQSSPEHFSGELFLTVFEISHYGKNSADQQQTAQNQAKFGSGIVCGIPGFGRTAG